MGFTARNVPEIADNYGAAAARRKHQEFLRNRWNKGLKPIQTDRSELKKINFAITEEFPDNGDNQIKFVSVGGVVTASKNTKGENIDENRLESVGEISPMKVQRSYNNHGSTGYFFSNKNTKYVHSYCEIDLLARPSTQNYYEDSPAHPDKKPSANFKIPSAAVSNNLNFNDFYNTSRQKLTNPRLHKSPSLQAQSVSMQNSLDKAIINVFDAEGRQRGGDSGGDGVSLKGHAHRSVVLDGGPVTQLDQNYKKVQESGKLLKKPVDKIQRRSSVCPNTNTKSKKRKQKDSPKHKEGQHKKEVQLNFLDISRESHKDGSSHSSRQSLLEGEALRRAADQITAIFQPKFLNRSFTMMLADMKAAARDMKYQGIDDKKHRNRRFIRKTTIGVQIQSRENRIPFHTFTSEPRFISCSIYRNFGKPFSNLRPNSSFSWSSGP